MRVKVSFYADTFRETELDIKDDADKILPKCNCYVGHLLSHTCERGRMIQNFLKEEMFKKFWYTGNIMLITGKKL